MEIEWECSISLNTWVTCLLYVPAEPYSFEFFLLEWWLDENHSREARLPQGCDHHGCVCLTCCCCLRATMVAAPDWLFSVHDRSSSTLLFLSAVIVGYVVFLVYYLGETRKLKHIPNAGFDLPLLSYLGAFRFLSNARTLIDETAAKFPNQIFKVPVFIKWIVILSGADLIEELRSVPENELSFMDSINEFFQVDYTLGPTVSHRPYHISVIRLQLTRAIPKLVPELHDEVVAAFDDLVAPPNDNDWKTIVALETMMKVVCRASNRVFVGLPLCRDPDYLDLNVQFTIDVVKTSAFLRLVPPFLRPIVNRIVSRVPQRIQRGLKLLEPIIDARWDEREKVGNGYEKPLDLLTWLMDDAKGEEQTAENLTRRVLSVNFAAIHTTSMTFTHALFYLAALPEYIAPLRAEVEEVVEREGWSKEGLDQMYKVDSFIKESQRKTPITNLTMGRVAKKDYTFADGTRVPRGTSLNVNAIQAHYDPEAYENPEQFDGFRFAKMRIQQEGKKFDIVTTAPEFLSFGHGRHACVGRYFAACELKIMLAHIVLNYDVKMENEGVRPPDMWVAASCVPNRRGKVMFRRHATT